MAVAYRWLACRHRTNPCWCSDVSRLNRAAFAVVQRRWIPHHDNYNITISSSSSNNNHRNINNNSSSSSINKINNAKCHTWQSRQKVVELETVCLRIVKNSSFFYHPHLISSSATGNRDRKGENNQSSIASGLLSLHLPHNIYYSLKTYSRLLINHSLFSAQQRLLASSSFMSNFPIVYFLRQTHSLQLFFFNKNIFVRKGSNTLKNERFTKKTQVNKKKQLSRISKILFSQWMFRTNA